MGLRFTCIHFMAMERAVIGKSYGAIKEYLGHMDGKRFTGISRNDDLAQ